MKIQSLLFGLLLCPTFLHAHATLETAEAKPNTYYKGVMRIPHGCEKQATHTVKIELPHGIEAVKPMPKAGWSLEINSKEIIWSKGNLSDDFYDEFVFRGKITAESEGKTLPFKTTQICANGQIIWGDVSDKADAHLKYPTPVLKVTGTAKPVLNHNGLSLSNSWLREPPNGAKVAGGFITITNNTHSNDRLISALAPFANRTEVHEMKHENGVMKMRELKEGLEIKAGETIMLKPASFHLMFMELKISPKVGDVQKIELNFEKAGKVTLDFIVEPLAKGATGHENH